MVYVRQSEKPVLDHVLIEKLQTEVGQLRGMILKLKEANAANKPHDVALQKTFQRIKVLESQLETEKVKVGTSDTHIYSIVTRKVLATHSFPHAPQTSMHLIQAEELQAEIKRLQEALTLTENLRHQSAPESNGNSAQVGTCWYFVAMCMSLTYLLTFYFMHTD